MRLPARILPWDPTQNAEALLGQEWLVTNGRGGYASGSIAGVPTRRFHGLLIAALPTPSGRTMMLNNLDETVQLPDGTRALLGGYERSTGVVEVNLAPVLREFRLEGGVPTWRFELGRDEKRYVIEKRIFVVHMQNTVHINYELLTGEGPLRIELRPSVHFRPHEGSVSGPSSEEYHLWARGERFEIHGPAPYPVLRLASFGARRAFTIEGRQESEVTYRIERSRGYDWLGDVWSPGYFRAELARSGDVTLVASSEEWETVLALPPKEALAAEVARKTRLVERAEAISETLDVELVLAADQFIITPDARRKDAAAAAAAGDEVRSVIAGYHWFTDWGRDTMISLEGLTLASGRWDEAGYILRTFAHYVCDGLIPNMFPEGQNAGLYHTADATLWFFHAIDRYVEMTGDRTTLRLLLPALREIFVRHMQGTRFGIGVDPSDGLLRQGAEGYQLTWMDAKVDSWVVTPRRGKAVEINALFYNACSLLARWIREENDAAAAAEVEAERVRLHESFNRRFWCDASGHLFDVVDGPDGDDAACRPNQIFAVSLPHPVLEPSRWRPVVDVVERELLTPVGLRSLARSHPDYRSRYDGDLRARDAAYHQGTVWSWLIGPFVDAWLKVHPGRVADAGAFLRGFDHHLEEAGIGQISEVFDAEEPYMPRGCIAQAWGVAEVLRARVKVAAGRAAAIARPSQT